MELPADPKNLFPGKNESVDLEDQLAHFRNFLLPYAYNVIGAVEPARDLVEEVIVPFFMQENTHVENVKGYLIRSVINKSISYKEQLRNRLEEYPGEWLPEPVATPDLYSELDKDRILNYSLLVLLEKLNPRERAVYILKNAFDYKHPDIAQTLEIREEHSRQLLKRSTDKIKNKRGARKSLDSREEVLLKRLVDAMSASDLPQIERLLTDTIEAVSDGGSGVSAARKVLLGKDRVSKLLKAIGTKYQPEGSEITITTLNHQPAILYRLNGAPFRAMVFEMDRETIRQIYIMVNPEKLSVL